MRASRSPNASKDAEITPPPLEIQPADGDAAPPGAAEPEDPTETRAAESTNPPLPTDAAGWRALIPTLPPRDLLRLVTRDKTASARIFAGFRASPEALRNPVVVQRLAEGAVKSPRFAEMLAEVRGAAAPRSGTLEFVLSPVRDARGGYQTENDEEATESHESLEDANDGRGGSDRKDGATSNDASRLRDKLKEQRAALRDKDAHLAALEAALAQARRERDAARADAEAARAASRASDADAERQRRLREREDRRESQQTARAEAAHAARAAAAPTPVAAPAATPSHSRLLESGMQRLLTRGRYAVVAEICREAIALESESDVTAADRGRLRALHAQALYGHGDPATGEEQDRIAAGHLIDAGELVSAAQALGRAVTLAPSLRPALLTPTFRRLFALAEKMGQIEGVNDVLTHVRIGSAEANRRLKDAIAGSESVGRRAGPLRRAGGVESSALIGPDEAIALPTRRAEVATVTPRSIVKAVDSGDAAYLSRAAAGLRALQARGETADRVAARALLFAVAALEPVALQPLTQTGGHQAVVVDASNVARHNPDPLALRGESGSSGSPAYLDQLKRMREFLFARGFFPVVMIADANLRFHIDDRAGYLDLVERGVVRETPPGTSADEALMAEAQHRDAPLVTNDRLSEWGVKANSIERLNFALLPTGVSLTPA